jgi:hypothetical protein
LILHFFWRDFSCDFTFILLQLAFFTEQINKFLVVSYLRLCCNVIKVKTKLINGLKPVKSKLDERRFSRSVTTAAAIVSGFGRKKRNKWLPPPEYRHRGLCSVTSLVNDGGVWLLQKW